MTDDNVVPLRRTKSKCPMCGKPSVADYRPFCSKRCADLDLSNWFQGNYAVPTDEEPDEYPREDD